MNTRKCYYDDIKQAADTERLKQRWTRGMNGSEIDEVMQKWQSQHYKGVFHQRELMKSGYLKELIARDKPFSIVISTNYMSNAPNDPENEPHWIAVYSNNRGECDYFDSYAIPPIQEDIVHFLDMIKEGGSVHTNEVALQSLIDGSRSCGFHCVVFLVMREYKKIKADEIHKVYPNMGQETHNNDIYATFFTEALLNKQY